MLKFYEKAPFKSYPFPFCEEDSFLFIFYKRPSAAHTCRHVVSSARQMYLIVRLRQIFSRWPEVSRARLGFGYFASTTQPVHTRQQCSYMGAWASQATVPFIQHICRYVQISSNIYKRKNRSTKAGHENPKKPAGGKNTGNVYPRPRQWCNPWGFRVC